MSLSKLPVFVQLVFVKLVPLHQSLLRTSRETPLDDPRADFDRDFVLTVLGMEMGRPMIVVQHVDDNSKKPTNLRHGINLPSRCETF